MAVVVRLVRNAAEAHGRDLFVCSVLEWRFLHDLAVTFGWQAAGTTYELPTGSKLIAPARRDYDPGMASDAKAISREDAFAWAQALERAQRSNHFSAFIERLAAAEPDKHTSVQSVRDWLAEFIQYAYGGAFTFALEEAPK